MLQLTAMEQGPESPVPSKSPAQARLMAAAAHTAGGYGGVPQAVGEEFNRADKGLRQAALAAALRRKNREMK